MRIADVSTGHMCSVHRSVEEYREIAAGFLSAAVTRREKAVLLDGAGDGDGLLVRLREDGMPVDRWLDTKALVLVDEAGTRRLVLSSPDHVTTTVSALVSSAAAEGFAGVRIAGTAPRSLRLLAGRRLLAFDKAVQAAIAGANVGVLCFYQLDDGGGPDEDLDELCAAHDGVIDAPAVFDDGSLRITAIGARVRLAGEIDLSHREALHRLLTAAAAQGVLAVDAASIRYVDLGSMRALVDVMPALQALSPRSATAERVLTLCGAFEDGALLNVAQEAVTTTPDEGQAR